MTPWRSVIVFAAVGVGDVVWARWAIAAAARRPMPAAWWAVGIITLGVVAVDAYIRSRWYVVPAAAGAGVGTFVAVRGAW